MQILGIACRKDHLYLATVTSSKAGFSVLWTDRLAVPSGSILPLLKSFSPILDGLVKQKDPVGRVVLVKCGAGQSGSSIEAVKAEAIVQLCCEESSLTHSFVAPQSLKKALGAKDDWQSAANSMFNSEKNIVTVHG